MLILHPLALTLRPSPPFCFLTCPSKQSHKECYGLPYLSQGYEANVTPECRSQDEVVSRDWNSSMYTFCFYQVIYVMLCGTKTGHWNLRSTQKSQINLVIQLIIKSCGFFVGLAELAVWAFLNFDDDDSMYS